MAAALTSLLLASGLCDGLPGSPANARADRARCEAECAAAPPSATCLLVARFGAPALTFLEEAKKNETLAREARAAELGLPARELLEYLDYDQLLFRQWPEVEALSGETRAAVEAAHRDNLANLDRVRRGELAEALAVATNVYETRRRWLGAAHPLTAQAQSNLGHLLRAFGRLDEAQEHLQAAYVACEAALGPDALETANRLNQLGSLALERGDLDAALAFAGQALGPYRRVLGDRHPATAAIRNNLGTVHTRRGELDAARRELSGAVAILMVARGALDPWTLQARGNLGGLLTDLGDLGAAEAMLRSVLSDCLANTPARLVAITRNNLAHVLHLSGRPVEAAGEYAAAHAATVAQFGESHVEALIAAQNVAQVLADAGDLEGARARLQGLLEPATANGEPLLLSTVEQNLGALLGELSATPADFDAALALTRAALARRRARFGAGHASVARAMQAQALVTWMASAAQAGGETAPSETVATQRELLGILRRHFHANLDAAESDLELLGFLATVRPSFDMALSMGAAPSDDATATLDDVLAWQGAATLAETAWRDSRRLEGRADPATRELWRRLRAVERERAAAVLGSGAGAAVERLAALASEASTLRKELETRVPGFAASRRPVLGTTDQVCERLRASGAALLDYVRFDRVLVGREAPKAGGARRVTHRPTYDVFTVVPKGERCVVKRARLGDASTIDAAVEDYRSAVTAAAQCGPATCSAAYGRLEKASEALWDRLVAPVATWLPESGTVWVVPDGRLVEVAFGTLMHAGRFALERWSLPVLPAPGALLTGPSADAGSGSSTPTRRGALVVGDVDYDRASALGEGWGRCDAKGCSPGSPPAPAPLSVASRRSAAVCGGPSERRFASLTPTEATQIAPSLALGTTGVTLALGAVATEAAVRSALEGQRVIHLATHGFYATEPGCASAGARSGRPVSQGDPLRLSALVFAGVNLPKDESSPAPLDGDGLLTARDISLLDLAGTELVSLSACETGLGTAAVGEGALGLARAFGVAGAGAVIASLWEVGNDETTALFTTLYQELAGGAAPQEALRAAQLALIESLRAEEPETLASAALWGAFQVQIHRPTGDDSGEMTGDEQRPPP